MTWISPEGIDCIQKGLNETFLTIHDKGVFATNPFPIPVRKRGRPTKKAAEERPNIIAKHWEWEREMDIKYPNRRPYLEQILAGSVSIVDVNDNIDKRKVKITYVQRTLE